MADIEITVDSGTSKRLLTGGKYCDKNILVTATGGGAEPEPPDDGKTRLYITVPSNSMPDRPPPRNQVPLYIQQTVDRGVTIDWGDGTEPETLPGTGKVNTTHTYEQAGDYVINLDPADGCELGFGQEDGSYCVMGRTSNNNGRVYLCMLKGVVIGNRGVKRIGVTSFYNCHSLASVTIPEGVNSIGESAFSYCHPLASVTIPDSVASIEQRAFYNCYSLASVTIPEGVTSIEQYAFSNCYGAKEYHLLSHTPISISNDTIFSNIPSDCVIYVPVGSLESYQTATNWSTYADQMREEGT